MHKGQTDKIYTLNTSFLLTNRMSGWRCYVSICQSSSAKQSKCPVFGAVTIQRCTSEINWFQSGTTFTSHLVWNEPYQGQMPPDCCPDLKCSSSHLIYDRKTLKKHTSYTSSAVTELHPTWHKKCLWIFGNSSSSSEADERVKAAPSGG